MVARLAEVEDREGRRRLPRARENRRHAPLERGDLLRHLVVRGVREARVEVARRLQVEEVRHLLRRLIAERGAGIHRHLTRLALLRLPTTLDAQRIDCHFSFLLLSRKIEL